MPYSSSVSLAPLEIRGAPFGESLHTFQMVMAGDGLLLQTGFIFNSAGQIVLGSVVKGMFGKTQS
jgi:hypothetical protein